MNDVGPASVSRSTGAVTSQKRIVPSLPVVIACEPSPVNPTA